jgi:hypothetical protein
MATGSPISARSTRTTPRHFPKLVTPQRVGEEGIEAVVVLAIDAGITHGGTLRASVGSTEGQEGR